jgi:hypothetical protein
MGQPHVLELLSSAPSIRDIVALFDLAQSQPGTLTQLPWIADGSLSRYKLSTNVPSAGGDPLWILSSGTAPREAVIWSRSTSDVELVCNLVSSELVEQLNTNIAVTQKTSFTYSGLPAMIWVTEAKPEESLAMASKKSKGSAFNSSESKPGFLLSGSLSHMEPASLLQSFRLTALTGRLSITNSVDTIDIFFEAGTPIHACALDATGDTAVLELLTWESGRFNFYPKEKCHERTIERTIESILMKGVVLLDQYKLLYDSGLRMHSYLADKQSTKNESEFAEKLLKGLPLDQTTQRDFYKSIGPCSTLFDVLRRTALPKAIWVPIVFNLFTCGLISITEKPTREAKCALLESAGLDQSVVQKAVKALVRPDTNLVSYPLALCFLQQEFDRFEITNQPFSIVIFDIAFRGQEGLRPLSNAEICTMAKCFEPAKRSFDILAHFQALEYIAILPSTDVAAASIVAKRLIALALADSNLGNRPAEKLLISCGVAGLPEDCESLGKLLAAALEAKNKSKETGAPATAFRTLYV